MPPDDIDHELKQLELALKRAELKAKEKETTPAPRFSLTTSIPLLIAFVGLAASAVTTLLQRATSIELEKSQFRSSLLLKALEAKDTENIAKALLFMVDTKILDDADGSIRRVASKPERLPTSLDTAAGIKFSKPKTTRKIVRIIVSDTQVETSYQGLANYLKQPAVLASYHYLIEPSGKVHYLVADSLIAFHTARFNATSLGVGVMHISNGTTGYNPSQLVSLTLLLTTLSQKYRIPADSIRGRNHYTRNRKCDFDLVKPQLAAALRAPAS